MTVDKKPCDYTPARGPVIYEISGCDPDKTVDVEVIDARTSMTAGRKRLAGEERYAINVAAYVQSLFDIGPARTPVSPGFVEDDSRTAEVMLRFGEVSTEPVLLLAAKREICPLQLLSGGDEVREMDIRTGRDEISLIAPGYTLSAKFGFKGGNGGHSFGSSAVEAGNGMAVMVVDAAVLAQKLVAAGRAMDEFAMLEVEVSADGSPVLSRRYMLREYAPHATTLAWINEMGAVDYYTFPGVEKTEITAGNKQWSTEGEISAELPRVVSGYENGSGISRLSEIASSPQVWRIAGGKAEAITVASVKAEVADGKPGRLSVAFKRMENKKLIGLS